MARKKCPVESPEALKVRLAALQEYIVHNERQVDQFALEVQKLVIRDSVPDGLDDLVRFVDSLLKAILMQWEAPPRTTLFEKDLRDSRAEMNAAYTNSEKFAEFKERLIAAGSLRREDKVDFDFFLSFMTQDMINRHRSLMQRLKSPDLMQKLKSPDDLSSLMGEVVEVVRGCIKVIDSALDPARLLRKRWLDMIAHPGKAVKKHRKPPGRPKNPEITKRDLMIFEAWNAGRRTYEELGREFHVKPDVARKAVAKIKRQNKTGRSKIV